MFENKTEERYQIEIDYWKQKSGRNFNKSLLNRGELLVMRKRCEELQQVIDSLSPPKITDDTDAIGNRYEILDL